ncbi:MAG: hypothetical protein H3C68_03765 [Deltaproteobacteria bacterium]|nr:hypothetical protein [Deltaproteobacteria bacterium]MBZ0219841.1 hypothetical protein [Deltaproteobacteria bacterium]
MREALIKAPLFIRLAALFGLLLLASCEARSGASWAELKSIEIKDDGTAVISLKETAPGGLVRAFSGIEVVTIVHHGTGVWLSCPMKYESGDTSVSVPNHGNILKSGDSVLVVIGKFSSAAIVRG